MSQGQLKNELNIWNWRSNQQGQIILVSSTFANDFTIQASKRIIGQYFWEFISGSKKIPQGWEDLEIAFKEHKKIKKFVFDYHAMGKKIKVSLIGEPIFEKGIYKGHQGTGYIADESEISIPEMAQNMLSTSLEQLDIGIAIFSKTTGLFEFNQQFSEHLSKVNNKITVKRNITFESLLALLNNHSKFNDDISYGTDQEASLYYKFKNTKFIHLRKSYLSNDFIALKTEINDNLLSKYSSLKISINHLKDKNNMLEKRVDVYKKQLSEFVKKIPEPSKNDTQLIPQQLNDESDTKKFLSFLENNLDVGILVTNIDGTVEHVNYFAAKLFGFVTVTTFMMNQQEKRLKDYLLDRQERTLNLLDSQLNRYEHIFNVDSVIKKTEVKETIIFYPSIHNPKKVISLFYPEPENTLSEQQEDMNTPTELTRFFTDYTIKNLQSLMDVMNESQNTKNKPSPKNKNSYQDILYKLSETKNICKVSPYLQNLEKSVFDSKDLIQETIDSCQENIKNQKISLDFKSKSLGLFIISDYSLFLTAFHKILRTIISFYQQRMPLNIEIIQDTAHNKINILMTIACEFDLEKVSATTLLQLADEKYSKLSQYLEYKIADYYLTLLGCSLSHETNDKDQTILNIEISGEMITNSLNRETDNVVV